MIESINECEPEKRRMWYKDIQSQQVLIVAPGCVKLCQTGVLLQRMGTSTSGWHWFHQQTEGQSLQSSSREAKGNVWMKDSNKALEYHIDKYSESGPARLACFWPGGIHLIENASRHSPSLITNATSCACPRLPRGCQSCWCPGRTMEAPWAPGWPTGYQVTAWIARAVQKIRVCFLAATISANFISPIMNALNTSGRLHAFQISPWRVHTIETWHFHAPSAECQNTHFTGLPSASAQAMTLGSWKYCLTMARAEELSHQDQAKIPNKELMSHRQFICTCNQHVETCWGPFLSCFAGMRLPWRPYSAKHRSAPVSFQGNSSYPPMIKHDNGKCSPLRLIFPVP